MAKKNVLVINDELFMGMDLDELKVYSGKGKAKKLDLNTTVTTVMSVLLYNSGLIDMFETLAPQVDALDSLSEFISERTEEYNLLFDSAIELDEKVEEAFDRHGIVRIGEEEEVEEDEEPEEEEEDEEAVDYSSMSLGELRKLCKENGIKYTPKDKAEALIEKLEALEEEEVEEDEEPEEEEEDEEAVDYSSMSLGELRKLCKENGIKYTPKDKAEALIEKLEALEEEEDEEGEVTEEELDEILDEEFEDEVFEEEKTIKNKNGKGKKKR